MKSIQKIIATVLVLFSTLLATSSARTQEMKGMKSMESMAATNAPVVPPVTGYSEGKTILFIHTETSDPKLAKVLTDMMGGSPVLVVPSLAKAPKTLLARVYVFTNGAKPRGAMGPLGSQPDVFENPPGSPGYSPLRKIVMVTWKNAASSRILKSSRKVEEAIKNGEIKTKETGIVVNMPMLTWPGGKR